MWRQKERDELLRLLQVDPLSGYAHVIVAFSDFASGRLVEWWNTVDEGLSSIQTRTSRSGVTRRL